MRKFMYETKPWVCLMIAAVGLAHAPKSIVAGSLSLILSGCALLILQWRFEYRKAVRAYHKR